MRKAIGLVGFVGLVVILLGQAVGQNNLNIVVAPQYVVGGGWRTEFTFINTGTTPAEFIGTYSGFMPGFDIKFLDGSQEYYRDNLIIKSKFPLAPNAMERITLVPCSSMIKPNCLSAPDVQVGFVSFSLPTHLKLQIAIHGLDEEGNLLSSMSMVPVIPGKRFVMPVSTREYLAGYALAYVSGDKSRVKLTLREVNGKFISTEYVLLDRENSRHIAEFINQRFPAFRGDGVLEIIFEAAGNIDPTPIGAVSALRFDFIRPGIFRMSNLMGFPSVL